MRGIVKEVQKKKLILTDGTELNYGLLVWSTGVGASNFVKALQFPKSPGGRYLTYPYISLFHQIFLLPTHLCI